MSRDTHEYRLIGMSCIIFFGLDYKSVIYAHSLTSYAEMRCKKRRCTYLVLPPSQIISHSDFVGESSISTLTKFIYI
jgi:hypothetical protein